MQQAICPSKKKKRKNWQKKTGKIFGFWGKLGPNRELFHGQKIFQKKPENRQEKKHKKQKNTQKIPNIAKIEKNAKKHKQKRVCASPPASALESAW